MAKEYSTVLPDLYRGIVEDNADDKHLGRCKVRVPAVYGDSKVVSKDSLPWALPISTCSVNKDRGSICIPDIGDYVWVMFEASDKTRPVYLGGFYAQSDIPIDETKVTVYIDKENAIIYDRKKESYDINVKKKHIIVNKDSITLDGDGSNAVIKKDSVTLNGDGSTIVILKDSVTIASPKVNISGELDVTGEVNMHQDLHVDGTIYCGGLSVGGSDSYIGDFGLLNSDTMVKMNEADYQEIISHISGDPGSFLYNVQLVKAAMAKAGVAYNQSGSVTLVLPDGRTFNTRTDCSGLVSSMVKAYAGSFNTTTSYGFVSAGSIPGFHDVTGTGELRAGDIVARNGHVEVFAYSKDGKNYVYSGGSTKSLGSATPTVASNKNYDRVWRPNR